MPDWRRIVGQHLTQLGLPPARRDEVCRELASHVEEEYERLRAHLSDGAAQQQALELLANPVELAREIYRAEEEDLVTKLMRNMWIPGLAMAGVYTLMLLVVGRWGQFATANFRVVFVSAILALMLIGVTGAYWARALGATTPQRILVSLAPIFVVAVSFLLAFPIHSLRTGRPLLMPIQGEVLSIVRSLVIQAGALLLGAAPFLRGGPRSSQTNS